MGNDKGIFAGIEEVVAAIKALTEAVERASHAELAKLAKQWKAPSSLDELDELIAAQSRLPETRMIEDDMSWIWQQAGDPRWRNLRGVLSLGASHQYDDGGPRGAVLFDLDGTLIDSVYQHVLAWRDALRAESIDLPVWEIHRKVGMSGGLFARALLRETGAPVDAEQAERLQRRHEDAFANYSHGVRPLPGARSLLLRLRELGVPWAIATSGRHLRADAGVDLLDIPGDEPLVTHDEVRYAKPEPDLFFAAAHALGVAIGDSLVVGDSVWDLLAARRAPLSGSDCSLADTGARNSRERAPFACTTTQLTCWIIWKRWACGTRRTSKLTYHGVRTDRLANLHLAQDKRIIRIEDLATRHDAVFTLVEGFAHPRNEQQR